MVPKNAVGGTIGKYGGKKHAHNINNRFAGKFEWFTTWLLTADDRGLVTKEAVRCKAVKFGVRVSERPDFMFVPTLYYWTHAFCHLIIHCTGPRRVRREPLLRDGAQVERRRDGAPSVVFTRRLCVWEREGRNHDHTQCICAGGNGP